MLIEYIPGQDPSSIHVLLKFIHRYLCNHADQPTNKSFKQWTNQSPNEPTNQSSIQPTNQPTNKLLLIPSYSLHFWGNTLLSGVAPLNLGVTTAQDSLVNSRWMRPDLVMDTNWKCPLQQFLYICKSNEVSPDGRHRTGESKKRVKGSYWFLWGGIWRCLLWQCWRKKPQRSERKRRTHSQSIPTPFLSNPLSVASCCPTINTSFVFQLRQYAF